MDTSVPGQQDASDAALVDMLMLEAPVGLGPVRVRPAFPLGECCPDAARDGSPGRIRGVGSPEPDPSGWTGLLPSEAWPEHVATRAEAALRKVLDEGVPLAERGYPVMSPPRGQAR